MNEVMFALGVLGSVVAIAALAALVADHVQMKARVRQRIKAITEARP
jgi:hypothetical protein